MFRTATLVLALGVTVFLASGATAVYGLGSEQLGLVLAAGCGLLLAGALVLLGGRLRSSRVDWDRIRAEQRLWESGPVGRQWLEVRSRLADRWRR